MSNAKQEIQIPEELRDIESLISSILSKAPHSRSAMSIKRKLKEYSELKGSQEYDPRRMRKLERKLERLLNSIRREVREDLLVKDLDERKGNRRSMDEIVGRYPYQF